MSREHKYRAWDKVDERMIVHEQDFIPLKVTSMGVLRLNPHHKQHFWQFLDADRFVLMQYIGRKDKKGEELYEDDICELDVEFQGANNSGFSEDPYFHIYTGVISFMPSIGYYLKVFKGFDVDNQEPLTNLPKRKHIAQYRTKRIGNKHQDPELFK